MSESAKIVIMGDIFPTPINYDLFKQGNAEQIFSSKVCEIVASADLSICNLEGCFTGEEVPEKMKDGPNIRAPKETIKGLANFGIDYVSLANNHVTDYGNQGYLDTLKTLDSVGIKYFGAGINNKSINTHVTIELKGRKIVLYGVSETIENVPSDDMAGVNIYDEYRVCSEINELKKNCDYLFVLYHGGVENIHYNTPSIRQRFHRMADSGADIIISQHTHAIGEEEFYNNSYMLYGQGNFCFHFTKRLFEYNVTGLLLEVYINDEGFNVKKHIVRRVDQGIIYDTEQDFITFTERSNRLIKNDIFLNELKVLADEKLILYLEAFRGINYGDKVLKRILPREKYINYLRSRYSKKKILKILLALQCEEFREVSARGFLNILEKLEERNNG